MIEVDFRCSAPVCPRGVTVRVGSEGYHRRIRLLDLKPRGWVIRTPRGERALAMAYCPEHAELPPVNFR